MSYYTDDTVTVFHGDCLDVLATLPDASVDAVVTDPPYGLEFMGKEWDKLGDRRQPRDLVANESPHRRSSTGSGVSYGGTASYGADPRVVGRKMQDWHHAWATECLRVLKPGGHLLAFGGTRTSHRLACAVEDAGFEIRDSIAWLYGSGFPKSLDVSKAIDRMDTTQARMIRLADCFALGRHIREQREAAGLTHAEVNAWFGYKDGCQHWERQDASGARVPTPADFAVLRDRIALSDQFLPLVTDRAVESENLKSREVVGLSPHAANREAPEGYDGWTGADRRNITAPATPDARTWQGWGTALKPAWEIVVTARKPHPEQGIHARIGSWLAQAADPTTPTGEAVASSDQTDTSPSASTATINSSTVSSWRDCWAELYEATSTSTTETTSSTTTDLRTLFSCLEQITPESITTGRTNPGGLSSLVEAVDAMFAAAVLNSRATRTLTAIGSATSATPRTSPAGGALSQIVVARKPLSGTVAANVLEHGVGALNIDECRVGAGAGDHAHPGNDLGKRDDETDWRFQKRQVEPGRWPANVVLDETQAAALDQQSGEGATSFRTSRDHQGGDMGWRAGNGLGFDDTGGASRFFYTAKADANERVRIDGTAHPTVKPLTLMRWLVRLVTPPGGTVLEPFAGSGTTVEACILEGFRCVAIEREADYLPLILQRIHRRRDPVAAVKATAEDGGLFDLLGGDEPA